MSAPRYAASQFGYGETVKCPGETGIVRGWDSSNTHLLLELESGEQSYFPIGSCAVEDL